MRKQEFLTHFCVCVSMSKLIHQVTEISKSYRRMSGMTFSPDELRIEAESRKTSVRHTHRHIQSTHTNIHIYTYPSTTVHRPVSPPSPDPPS